MGDYFGNTYFAADYFGDRYFGPDSGAVPPPALFSGGTFSEVPFTRDEDEDVAIATALMLER